MNMNQTEHGDIYGTDWVNARKFGFVADGVTPNDDAFARYIAEHSEKPLYFGPGVYAFEKTLNFPRRVCLELDANAELKCIAKEPLDFFITLRYGDEGWGAFEDYALRSYIKGGVINANFCAKTALGVHGALHTHYRDFMIRDVLEKGIMAETSKMHDGCSYFENIYFYNSKAIHGTVAMYDNTADNVYMMCTAVNFETGIYTSGGKFTHVSCWFNSYGVPLIPTSVYAVVVGGNQSVFINPMVDTYRTGFKLIPNQYDNYPSTSITDLVWITNRDFYTDGFHDPNKNIMKDYPMLVFDCASDECHLMVNGMYMPWREWGFAFSNIPLPSSTFDHVRYEPHWDPWNHMANFRDDTNRMRAGKAIDDWSDLPTHEEWHKN